MRFEELIWKYIDSELTIEEDRELRSYMSNDPAKKAEFEEYVELSYLLKKDAKVNLLSEKEQDEMEDNLLMYIMDEQSKFRFVDYIRVNVFYSAVASVLVFFILSSPIVDNSNYNDEVFKNNFMISVPLSELTEFKNKNNNIYVKDAVGKVDLELLDNVAGSEFVFESDIKVLGNDEVKVNFEGLDLVSQDLGSYLSDNVLLDEKFAENNFVKENLNGGLSKIRGNYNEMEKNNLLSGYLLETPRLLSLNYEQPDLKLQDVSFESNVLSDIVRTGFNPIDNRRVSSFAQSISVSLSESSRLGVEFGLSEYQFNVNRRVTIPYRDAGGLGGDLVDGRRMANGILTELESEITYNVYFSSLFYDYSLMENRYFNLNGRLGFGVSNGGVLSTGRFYAEIPIFGPLNYIMGVDVRLFQNDNVFYNQNGNVNSNVSFVNGVYFKF